MKFILMMLEVDSWNSGAWMFGGSFSFGHQTIPNIVIMGNKRRIPPIFFVLYLYPRLHTLLLLLFIIWKESYYLAKLSSIISLFFSRKKNLFIQEYLILPLKCLDGIVRCRCAWLAWLGLGLGSGAVFVFIQPNGCG